MNVEVEGLPAYMYIPYFAAVTAEPEPIVLWRDFSDR